jgi:molecular chaperone DnaK (HSP70)
LPTKKEVSAPQKKKNLCAPWLIDITDRQIPSILSYVDKEEFHGTQAKAQLIRNSKNTVAYFRDYLGKE